jgi:hypothetical protein
MNDLQTRRGEDAYGVQRDYDEWYRENSTKAGVGLENGRQREMFAQLAESKFESDANTMGAYAVEQHFRYRESVYQDVLATGIAEVSNNPLDIEALNDEIANVKASLDGARPGLDNGAEFERVQAQLILAAIQGQMSLNPGKAQQNLKQFKDELGAAYPGVKEQVDSAALSQVARQKFPEDFNAQYDFIAGTAGITERVRSTALGRVNSAEAEAVHRRNESRKEERLVQSNSIYKALGEGDFAEVRRLAETLDISGGTFTEKEKLGFMNLSQSQTFVTDPIAEQQLQLDIVSGRITSMEQLLEDPRIMSLRADAMRPLFVRLEKATGSPKAKAEAARVKRVVALSEKRFNFIFKDTDLEGLTGRFFSELMGDRETKEAELGRPVTVQEMEELADDLLRFRVKEISFWPDKKWRRIQQILGDEDPTLEETEPTDERDRDRRPSPPEASRGERSGEVIRELFAGGSGEAGQAQATGLKADPLLPLIDKIPGELRTSLVAAMHQQFDTVNTEDIWKVYSTQFPEEAKRIAEAEGL